VVFQCLPTKGRSNKMLNTISSGIVPDFLPKCTYHNMHHDVMGGFAFKLVVATF
jgi:hypothetical protein